MTFRILWAEAIDDIRTAMVIQLDREYWGGVAILFHFDWTIPLYGTHFTNGSFNIIKSKLDMSWEWVKIVKESDLEGFRKNREWDKPREIEQILQLEHKP